MQTHHFFFTVLRFTSLAKNSKISFSTIFMDFLTNDKFLKCDIRTSQFFLGGKLKTLTSFSVFVVSDLVFCDGLISCDESFQVAVFSSDFRLINFSQMAA